MAGNTMDTMDYYKILLDEHSDDAAPYKAKISKINGVNPLKENLHLT